MNVMKPKKIIIVLIYPDKSTDKWVATKVDELKKYGLY